MTFSITTALGYLRDGLSVVEKLSSLATAVGAPTGIITTVTKIGGALLETAENINDKVDEGKIVASSTDQIELKSILADIQAENDKLMAYIESH